MVAALVRRTDDALDLKARARRSPNATKRYHPQGKPTPYWWEAYKPVAGDLADVPRSARVVIVGADYAGLSCAIELTDAGSRCASSRLPSSVPGATRAAVAE